MLTNLMDVLAGSGLGNESTLRLKKKNLLGLQQGPRNTFKRVIGHF